MSTFDAPVLRWGERSALLPKRLIYVFSLQVEFVLRPDRAGVVGRRLVVPLETKPTRADQWSTYHVLREDLVVFGDGIVREVPRARVQRGTSVMEIGENDVGDISGRMLLDTDASATLAMSYGGVLTVEGGTSRLFQPAIAGSELPFREGKAQIAVHSDSEHTKHRWLLENQLFGYGRLAANLDRGHPHANSPACWRIVASFDFYSS